MSADWISIYQEVFDQDKVDAYARLARPALEAAGGTFVARGLTDQTYEAGEATRTALLVFDSVETARAAHDSPVYQEALAALDGGARALHAHRARAPISRRSVQTGMRCLTA